MIAFFVVLDTQQSDELQVLRLIPNPLKSLHGFLTLPSHHPLQPLQALDFPLDSISKHC